MTRLGDRALVRRRFGASGYVAGRAVAPSHTDTTFMGSVQPMKGRDRQVLAEGLRQRDGKKIYTDRGSLQVDDQLTGAVADQVGIDGVFYTVAHVDNEHPLIPHDHVLIVRVQEGP